jgi:uncharacterized membrane protein YcaP (DUF421 family)
MTHDLLHLGLPWWDKVVRTLVVYVALIFLLRVAGKRQLAQLNSFDLVVFLLLSNVVQNAIIGNETSLPGGLLGAVILITGNYGLVRLAARRPRLRHLLQGRPTRLYEHGHLRERNLHHELMTPHELVTALRQQGLELDEVDTVDLEPEGTFNAAPKVPTEMDQILATLQRIEQKLG